jgi:hypothetical protein
MASWYVNPGLAVLIVAIRLRFAGISIGTIGDPDHQSTVSDHNPNGAGRVNAADFMLGKAFTHSWAVWLCAWLIQDSRTRYVIYNRRIWRAATGRWEKYTGKDPHTNHVHLSVYDSARNNTKAWQLEKEKEIVASYTPSWNDPTVLALNFLFKEAARASVGGANTASNNDKNARNVRNYLNNVLDYSVTSDLDDDQETPDDGVAGIASV